LATMMYRTLPGKLELAASKKNVCKAQVQAWTELYCGREGPIRQSINSRLVWHETTIKDRRSCHRRIRIYYIGTIDTIYTAELPEGTYKQLGLREYVWIEFYRGSRLGQYNGTVPILVSHCC
jgi:hypothetical protein